jgi:hypothetical protein
MASQQSSWRPLSQIAVTTLSRLRDKQAQEAQAVFATFSCYILKKALRVKALSIA